MEGGVDNACSVAGFESCSPVRCRSRKQGTMHACGHDGHMAMLLGGARLLKEREADLQVVALAPASLYFTNGRCQAYEHVRG